jgi:hypothetical protein
MHAHLSSKYPTTQRQRTESKRTDDNDERKKHLEACLHLAKLAIEDNWLRGGHRQAVEDRFKRLRKQIGQDLEYYSGKEIASEEFKNTVQQIDIYGNSCSLFYSYIYNCPSYYYIIYILSYL